MIVPTMRLLGSVASSILHVLDEFPQKYLNVHESRVVPGLWGIIIFSASMVPR